MHVLLVEDVKESLLTVTKIDNTLICVDISIWEPLSFCQFSGSEKDLMSRNNFI